MTLISKLKEAALNAAPGSYETRCREFSNHAPLEIWTNYGWLDQLPRQYREPTYEYIAICSPENILLLIEKLRLAAKGLKDAAIRLEILTGRMRRCDEKTGEHELLDEAEAFCLEAREALSELENE